MSPMVELWPVNCGAPLDPEKVKAGLVWCAAEKRWMTHQENGAEVFKAPDGWWTFFGVDYHEGKRMLREFQEGLTRVV